MSALPTRTPSQVLEDEVVVNMSMLAWCTGGLHVRGDAKGCPDPRQGRALVRTGAVRLVDPNQPVTRWVVATAEVRRYLEHGPRRGADIVELRGVS